MYLNRNYVNGEWNGEHIVSLGTLYRSFDGTATGETPYSSVAAVTAASVAAADAFPAWSSLPGRSRADYLEKIANALQGMGDELAGHITDEVGMPLKLSSKIQVAAPIAAWRFYASAARQDDTFEQIGHSRVYPVPVGPVACITPWNYPLHQITAKVAAALAAGCTVVLKPAELAPAAAMALGKAAEIARLPAGVLNIVFGSGTELGPALIRQAGIKMVSFTGSTRVGREVAALAGQGLQRAGLELGGKSASVLLEGADLSRAVKTTLALGLLNSGQTCSALTRVIVPEARFKETTSLIREACAAYTMGDPRDPATRLGPLVSAQQVARVEGFAELARGQDAECLYESQVHASLSKGFFSPLRVYAGLSDDSALIQEEIFGPIICLQTYTDEDQALQLANGTAYGLAGAVWGPREPALSFARKVRAGQVDVNGAAFNPLAPFGGFGLSGFGRENGLHGMKEFQIPSSIQGDWQTDAP